MVVVAVAAVVVCHRRGIVLLFLVHAQERSITQNAVCCVCVSMDQWGRIIGGSKVSVNNVE